MTKYGILLSTRTERMCPGGVLARKAPRPVDIHQAAWESRWHRTRPALLRPQRSGSRGFRQRAPCDR